MSGIKKIVTLISVAAIAGLGFIWFGLFNVAANDKHWGITTEFLEIVRDRSISSRAGDISVPNLTDTSRVKRGVANYDAMCAQCHLAPGLKTSELYEGLNPKPPVLYKDEHFDDMPPANTFWTIKNGIKMTGMPAWGIYNSDEQIWDLIATISAMDKMSPEKYQELVASGAHTHKGGGHAESEAQSSDHHGSNEATGDHHSASTTTDHHGNSSEAKNDHHAQPAKKKSNGHDNSDGHHHSH